MFKHLKQWWAISYSKMSRKESQRMEKAFHTDYTHRLAN
uniref:Uncharacterized protein n=1 Tax=Rhizophora mucronata TaxID=61149 RepID=A0A2P2NSD7_RHIMU